MPELSQAIFSKFFILVHFIWNSQNIIRQICKIIVTLGLEKLMFFRLKEDFETKVLKGWYELV